MLLNIFFLLTFRVFLRRVESPSSIQSHKIHSAGSRDCASTASQQRGNDTHDHWLWKTGYRLRRNRKCCTPPLQNISLARVTAGWCPHSVTPAAVFKFRNRLHSPFLLSRLSNSVEKKKKKGFVKKEKEIPQAGCTFLYIGGMQIITPFVNCV